MTTPITDPLPGSGVTGARPRAEERPHDGARLAGLALMTGCVLSTAGFAAISLVMLRNPDAPYTDPLWQPLYGVALAGGILAVLGLPAVLAVHGHASRRLTLAGYLGLFLPLVMLNVAETLIEAFVKPYLAGHGGVPDQEPTGLEAFGTVALVSLVVGAICLATAVFRARVVPLWVGVALLLSVAGAWFLHGGPLGFVSDYVFFAAVFMFGLRATRPAVVASAV